MSRKPRVRTRKTDPIEIWVVDHGHPAHTESMVRVAHPPLADPARAAAWLRDQDQDSDSGDVTYIICRPRYVRVQSTVTRVTRIVDIGAPAAHAAADAD